jgi:arylsulfatase
VRRLLLALLLGASLGGCGPAAESGPRARHLVLVTVDTLRADRLGAYGWERARTPAIDALAAVSIRFDRAYAHSSMTLPSVASLFTGQLVSRHHIFSNFGMLSEDLPTLASRLSQAGFSSAAFVGSYALRPARRLDRGFARYTRRYASREHVRAQPENLAGPLTDAAIAWLAQRAPGERLFLWMHYQEPHGPYTPERFEPPVDDERVLPRGPTNSGQGAIPRYQWLGHGRAAEYEARYDGEVAEVDRQLGRLLDALRERGLFEESLVVFTADHGEAFGEEGLHFAHGEGLGEALLRVPLLLHVPGEPAAVRGDAVRLIDVAPTALALLGLPAPDLPGESLLRDVGDRPLVAQVVRADRRWRSIRGSGFSLVEGSGPAGFEPLAADAAALADPERARARERLSGELERLAPWPGRQTQEPLSAEERRALEALGYVD